MLAGGTGLAQVITIGVSPILTRIYSPADFGLFAVFMVLISCVAPMLGGRYELAQTLPKSDAVADHVFGIAMQWAVGVSLLAALMIFLFQDRLLQALDSARLGGWVLLAPATMLMMGTGLAIRYRAVRHGEYSRISTAQILQAALASVLAIALGLGGAHFGGLIVANLVGAALFMAYLAVGFRKGLWSAAFKLTPRKRILAVRYKEFPVFAGAFGLLDGLTLAIPVLFISRYFPEAIVGYFALVLRVANAPIGFIALAVSQVNLKTVSEMIHRREDIRRYLRRTTLYLTLIASVPMTILMLFGPALFEFVFGPDWREAGQYARILAPALLLRFVVSTLSSTLSATNNNRLYSAWQVLAFSTTLALFIGLAGRLTILDLLLAFVLLDIVLYLIYFGFIWRAAISPRPVLARGAG